MLIEDQCPQSTPQLSFSVSSAFIHYALRSKLNNGLPQVLSFLWIDLVGSKSWVPCCVWNQAPTAGLVEFKGSEKERNEKYRCN